MICRYNTALCRGINAKFPCPRCLIPYDKQSQLSHPITLRTQQESKKTYLEASKLLEIGRKDKAEETLKGKGLCYVKNAWWELSGVDVHKALSYDVLHSIYLGVWGDHLWPLLLDALGPDGKAKLDER